MNARRSTLALAGLLLLAPACRRGAEATGDGAPSPSGAPSSSGAALDARASGPGAAAIPSAAATASGAAATIDPPPASPAASAAAETPPAAPRPRAVGGRPWGPTPLGSPTAFDLILVDGQPLALWGAPATAEGGVRAQPLDAAGVASGPPRTWSAAAPRARVLELAAAADGAVTAALWVEDRAGAVKTFAAVGAADAPPRVSEIGAGLSGGGSSRGALAVARTGPARFEALFRSGDGRCAGGEAGCVGFGAVELTPAGVRPHGLPLSVPEVCEPALAGFAHLGDQWHYGVCSRQEGRPAITLFSRQPEPQYARAERVLDGCVPAGAATLGEGAFFVGQCGVVRRAVRVDRADRPPLAVEGTPTLACHGSTPELAYAGHQQRLEAPRDGLAALLSPTLAPRNARAVWTGQALLVAVALGSELHLRRHECVGGALVPTGAY